MKHPFAAACLLFVAILMVGCASPPVRIISADDNPIDGLSQDDIVIRYFTQREAISIGSDPKTLTRCGYALSPRIWKMTFANPGAENESFDCQVPADNYVLLELISALTISLGPSGTCESTILSASRSVDEFSDAELLLDDQVVMDLKPFRRPINGCRIPIGWERSRPVPAGADGYFVLLAPLGESRQRFRFAVTHPCWYNRRDPDNGQCPADSSRRTVELIIAGENAAESR